MICDQGTGGLIFLVGVIFSRREKFKPFWFLVGHPGLPIGKDLTRVLAVLAVVILKRVSESIFFRINKFTANLKIKKRWQTL